MNVSRTDSLPLTSEADVVQARQVVRTLSKDLGFSLVNQTKIVTAASELARNALIHGGGGAMRWEVLIDGTRTGLRLSFQDQGPGIPDIERALTDGWSSGTGLGLGLSGARRLANDFELTTEVGKGTTVVITRWK
jgi:serine/threonine-protein kinase RsbT